MSTMPSKVVLSALGRLKTLAASALSFGSVRWRLMAVLLAVSLAAYGFLLYGQYRDQYDKILSFAQSSNRLLTEVMARRIDGAVRKLDRREANRTVIDTIRATEMAIGRQQGQASEGSGDSAAALIAFSVIRSDNPARSTFRRASLSISPECWKAMREVLKVYQTSEPVNTGRRP